MGLIRTVAGVGVSVIIGGTAYTVSQGDVINNFADDTGLTQTQAEEYVNNVDEQDLISYSELGDSLVQDGRYVLDGLSAIDCVNYEYDWESPTMSCEEGKAQLKEVGNDEIALGAAYKKLDTTSNPKTDIPAAIALIDEVNSDYEFEIVTEILDASTVDETKKSNSYNKATLQAVLDSQ